MADALFVTDGTTYTPTELSRGPWDPNACHGGPTAALLARAVESVGAPGPMEVARLTVELLRPVGFDPVIAEATVLRGGKKIQLVEATLTLASSTIAVARARALRIRREPVRLPAEDPVFGPTSEPAGVPFAGPEGSPRGQATWSVDHVAFHRDSVEYRFVVGSWAGPGPVTVWTRLLVPLFAHETPTSLQRVAASADFANGIAYGLPTERYSFVNPDLTIYLGRPVAGDWVGLDSRSHYSDLGIGYSDTALYDTTGRVGRSVQSIIVEQR
jgi:hypothetical protein